MKLARKYCFQVSVLTKASVLITGRIIASSPPWMTSGSRAPGLPTELSSTRHCIRWRNRREREERTGFQASVLDSCELWRDRERGGRDWALMKGRGSPPGRRWNGFFCPLAGSLRLGIPWTARPDRARMAKALKRRILKRQHKPQDDKLLLILFHSIYN